MRLLVSDGRGGRGHALAARGPGRVEALLKVMCIDDSRTVHAFLRKCLGEAHEAVEVVSAMDGQEAVDRFRAEPALKPDLIFLDWEMPRLDGPGTFRELRQMGVKTPVIMLTSKNEVADIAQMIEAGVDEYVLKPFTVDIILEKASSVLGVELGNAPR